MKNKFIVLAGFLFCMAPLLAQAAESSFSYTVSDNYELVLTLKNADKIAINNSVRYYRGGTPSLDARVTSNAPSYPDIGGRCYYVTTIEVYDEGAKKVIYSSAGTDSFSLSKFVTFPKNVTINVLIEYWIDMPLQMHPASILPDILSRSNQFSIKYCEDTTVPVVSISYGGRDVSGDLYTNQPPIELIGTAVDEGSGVNDGTWTHKVGSAGAVTGDRVVTSSGEASQTVVFEVKDRLENTGKKSIKVISDKTAPVVSLWASPSYEWTGGSGITVTASASDSRAGVDANTWQYSTNGGTTWSAKSTTKEVTVTGEGKYDIRFRVKDRAGNTGVNSIVRGIDRTPPVLEAKGGTGDAWSVNSPVVLDIKAPDALSGLASLEYSFDNIYYYYYLQSPNIAQTSFTVTGEGKRTIFFRAKDAVGNTSTVTTNVNIDTKPPQYFANLNGRAYKDGNGWVIPAYVSSLSDAISGVDYDSFKYSLDGGAWTKLPGSFSESNFTFLINVSSLSAGAHTIKLRAADKAGNTGEQSFGLIADYTAPVISGGSLLGATASGAPWTNQDRFNYSFVDAESGIRSYTVTVNTVLSTGYVSSFSGYSATATTLVFSAGAPDGTYQILLKATNGANSASSEKTFYYRLDRTAPVISSTLIKSASRSVTISGTDALSGLNSSACWTSAVTGTSGPSGYTVNLPDGTHEKEFTLRDIAGNSVTKKVTIYVEQGPPTVTVTAPEYGSAEKLPVTISITTVVMGISDAWYAIDGVKTVLPKTNWNSVSIPLGSYAEGSHTLKIGATNEVNVSAESAARRFIIDRTAPQLKSYELRNAANPEHIIADGEYSPGGAILVKVAGEDLYKEGSKNNPGAIKHYSWAITRRLSDPPAFASDKRSTGNEFTAQNFNDGLSYLCVRAEDAAGNLSQDLKIIVLQDQSSPGAPVIKSSTHVETSRVEQAGFLSNAEFSFIPAFGMKSGIKAYQWKVEKLYIRNNSAGNPVPVREGETTEIDQEGRSSLSLELADNDENEFYQLLAWCVGGNGNAGLRTAYRFRIDSEAPGGLILQAVPQADSASWYNQGDALVRWNKPQDMTGVAEYRYIVLEEEEHRSSPLEGRDTLSWNKTTDTQLRVNLRTMVGAKKSGTLRIGVNAVDYAGNSKLGQLSFGYDFAPPRFNQGALVISNAEDALGVGKRIRWGGLQDGESGPDRLVILVSDGDTTSAFTVGPELTEYVVSPLEENKAFTVVVRGYDRAGNQAELYDACATGAAAIPPVYYIPYLETINGHDISGKKRIEGGNISFESVMLQIPEGLELSVLVNSKGAKIRNPLREIPLETVGAANGVFQTGKSGSGTYELRSGGFSLEASALSFSRDGGLSLENAAYIRPVSLSGVKQERRISLGAVNGGNPPLMQFSSGSSALGVEARLESVYRENSGGEAQNGFALTGVDSLFLSGGREWLGGAGISFDRKPLTDMGIGLENDQGTVLLKNSSMEALSANLAALLDIPAEKPLSLVMGNAVYRVAKAGIRGNLLDIYEAVLPLPQGYEPPELTVRNITIDTLTRTVREGTDFSAGTIAAIGPDGVEFEGTMIRFDSQGNLLVTGAINSQAYGIYRVEDIPLSGQGIDWDLGAEITGFAAEVHGFLISAQKARVTGSGIFIPEGKIDVWNNQQTIVALGLRADRKDAVWQDGMISGIFYGDPGYGAPVRISGGRVSHDGVFATATIPLGDSVADATGATQWTLAEARLYPHYAMTGSFPGEKTIVVADTIIKAENCFFDEQGLRIEKARVEHIPNLSPETVVFSGMGLAYQGVSIEGVSENKFLFAASGWQINYASLGFDGQGIKGRGSLALPEKLGGLALVFPQTRIAANGSLDSGNPDETREILRFHGLPVFANGVGLKVFGGAYALELASPWLSLQPIKGPDIFFGKTVFDAEGKTLLGEKETRKIDFISFNGYRIGLENSGIDDQGFFLSGTISLELFGKSIAIPGGTYRILPDLSISGTGPDTGLTYSFGDWSISGKDIVFDPDRIRIGSNRVLFREIEFDLGEIPFGLDGRLLQNVAQHQELEVSLFGAGARISETRLSEGGIEAAVLITLPSVLGGKSFSFDRVGFRANGSFWVEKKVDAFSFAALGFSFALEELTLDEFGLRAAKTSITLPASMEAVSFSVQDLRIGAAGEVSIGNAAVTPFALWNMNFDLNSFSIVDGEAAFQGKVSLPAALPGELSGRAVQIRDFRASLAGGITAMDICLEGDYTVPFSNAWNLLFRNVRISYAAGQPWISAERTELLFPEEYATKNGYVDQAKFNPLTGQFVFSEIAFATDISMDFWGVNFTLTKLKIDASHALEFGGSANFPDSGLPAFLAGKTVAFNRFEIKSDGTLGAIDIKLEGLEGALIPGFDGLVLKKGSIALLKQGDKSLILDIGGNITLSASMPAGLAGAALKVETFTYDTAARKITRLKATTVLPTANSLGNVFSKLSIGIDWNEVKQTGFVNLAGNLKLPASFPDFLAGKEAKISNFKIGFDGVIQSFTAKYATEKNKAYDAFGFLQLSDVAIEAALKSGAMQFALDGTVILPSEKFPQGIGGLRAAIAMEFDTTSGLKAASAQATLPNSKLFGSMEVRGGRIGISKPAGKPLEISVGGDIVLPAFFPEGLRGIVVGIRKFTMDTSGAILDVDIGTSGIGAKIFGAAELSKGSVDFKKGEGDEFLIALGGEVRLVGAGLPEGLKNAAVDLRTLELSTRDGLRAFDAGVKGELSFLVLGGLKITVSSLNFSETGISMAASAKLPANYPNGLANTQFDLSALKMGWNGALLDIKGGLKTWSLTLAGFTATIEELYFDKTAAGQFSVALKTCKIKIPENFGSIGGQSIAIKNSKFSPIDGSFLGDIEVSKLETEIAGFKLILDKPSLSVSEKLVNFSKVTLKMPEILGKSEVALKKVTLSATEGMKISGGAFKLPSFDVGLFAFNDVKVDFSMSGSQYSLEGGGSVIIPGAGNIGASLGFATKSDTYPIGLKRAEFSYALNLGGIPLGATGLFITGIAGGISYGPPTEVPELGRGLFNKTGPRIKVGLSLGDSTGGSVINMTPTTWVDITNGAWAFEGRATVLKGSLNITADISAALGGEGFVGKFDVDIAFAQGGVTVYVFDKAGNTIMSGEGYVRFGIPTGRIIDGWLIQVPPSTLWIAKVNAAFGKFTNGKTGIKGTVDLPVLGSIGAFVGSGGLEIGSLSSYVIEKPNWSKNIRFFSDDNINSYDAGDSSGNEDTRYQFFVPPKGSGIAAPLSLLHEEYQGNETIPGSGLDRLILVLEYPEGAPELSVISPLGIEYREGSEGCETLVEKNGVIMIVHSTEAGIWQLRVQGLEEEAYHVSALGSMAMPLLELEEPALLPDSAAARTRDEARVRGKIEKGRNSVRIFARISRELPGFDLGSYDVDAEGRFDLMVSLGDLADGEYLIYAELDGPGAEFAPAAYAPGKILLDRSDLPMLAPLVRIAETDSGILNLRWQNTNAGRSQGYKVKIHDPGEDTESILYVGNISSLDLPGYAPEQELSFSVAALDHAGLTGPWSDPVSIRPGREKPLVNRPAALSARVEAKGCSGGFIEGLIRADIVNFQGRSDAAGYIGIRYAGPPPEQFPALHFGSPVPVAERGVELPWSMGIDESMAPGLYEYPCELFNEANGALNSPFVLAVEISWPAPEIAWLDPGEIRGTEETALSVYGNGFVPGTRVFWRDEELAILGGGSGSLQVIVPSRFSATEAQRGDTEQEELVVQGPGGDKALFPVTVLLPSYELNLYTRIAETRPGGRVDYAIAVESLNGFTGNLSFRALEKPEELEIILPEFALRPEAAAGSAAGAITIQVAKDALPGSYTAVIEGDGGKLFELVVVALSEPPLPVLSSVIPRAAYIGDRVSVYGNNFGKEGKLLVNDRETPVSSWSEGEILFVVPDDALSGAVHILSGGARSNALPFMVRDRGFELRPSASILELGAGEEKTLSLALTGHEDTVSLSLACEPGAPFTAALNRTSLKPGDPLELLVKADAFAGNGSWAVVLHGESRGFEVSVEIRVIIGNSLRISTSRLPDGLVDTDYYAELASQNARGALSYRVAWGNLPPGLSMTAHGILSGRPTERGRYQMDIEARDSLGWKDKRSFTITVWEENWGQAGKDGGHTRSVKTDLPANNDTAWIYEGKDPIVQILGAEERIIALGAKTLFALNARNGSLSWSTQGSYEAILCAGAKLYALAEGGRLEVRDPLNGALLWTRENIEAISSDGSTVLEETATRRFFRNAERGALIAEQGKEQGDGAVLWHYGSAYSLRGSALVPRYGSGAAWDAGETILAAAADARGGAAITGQFLILFDRTMTELRRTAAAHGPGAMLSLTDGGVSVLDGGYLRSYDREDLGFQWARRVHERSVLANGLEKTVVAGPEGLMVLNRYDGNVIWRDERPCAGFALYHGKIFASGQGGAIVAFNGVPNVSGPLTELRIDPPSPGESLWHTRQPRVAIASVDRETYAERILMRHNNGPWIDAPGSFEPEEGEHHIAVYGVDSRGVAGAEATLQLKVDTGLPESDLEVSPEEPESGWHNGPVTLVIDAWDDVSGIDWIWTSSSAYTGPVILSAQGTHRFSWQALDRAGNREPLREITIKIDREPPLAEVSLAYDGGLAELAIAASDSLSGPAFIEYRINRGAAERYGEPLVFVEPGTYHVGYRAFDRAGNSGEWRTCEVFVAPDNADAELIDTPLVNGMPRKVMLRARNGMPLVDQDGDQDYRAGDPLAMANLPLYALGAEYIRWDRDDAALDEGASIRFRAKRNVVIYLFLPHTVPAPRGWSLVEDRAGINRLYYPGGAGIYMRRYGAGALVELPGTPAGVALPLIMAQEKGELTADILIRRESGSEALILEALVQPRLHSRRLPLHRRWFVNAGDGWEPLEGNRYEQGALLEDPPEDAPIAAPLRFRLELCFPDGEVERRVEKVFEEEENF